MPEGVHMAIMEQIEADLRESIKAKDEVKVRTLRMLKSDITAEKTRGTEALSDEKVLEIIARSAKKRKEAIEEFTKGNRSDLVEREQSELSVIEGYLPAQLGDEDVAKSISAKIAEMGEVTKKDFGRIMGAVMKDLKGQADGAMVRRILTQKLENM
jgi:uncharacterized protein YqeY